MVMVIYDEWWWLMIHDWWLVKWWWWRWWWWWWWWWFMMNDDGWWLMIHDWWLVKWWWWWWWSWWWQCSHYCYILLCFLYRFCFLLFLLHCHQGTGAPWPFPTSGSRGPWAHDCDQVTVYRGAWYLDAQLVLGVNRALFHGFTEQNGGFKYAECRKMVSWWGPLSCHEWENRIPRSRFVLDIWDWQWFTLS